MDRVQDFPCRLYVLQSTFDKLICYNFAFLPMMGHPSCPPKYRRGLRTVLYPQFDLIPHVCIIKPSPWWAYFFSLVQRIKGMLTFWIDDIICKRNQIDRRTLAMLCSIKNKKGDKRLNEIDRIRGWWGSPFELRLRVTPRMAAVKGKVFVGCLWVVSFKSSSSFAEPDTVVGTPEQKQSRLDHLVLGLGGQSVVVLGCLSWKIVPLA